MGQYCCGMSNLSSVRKGSLGVISLLSYLSKNGTGCPFQFDFPYWLCYHFHIAFTKICILKETAHYDCQSANGQKLANFQRINVPLRERQFIVGPNASGKSNLLDIFLFLRDIVKAEGGGLQKAISARGGVTKIRCLSARQDAEVAIEIHIADTPDTSAIWRYSVGFRQADHGKCQAHLTYERVWRGDELLLDRPDADDNEDPDRLTQTALEQIAANAKFREIGRFLRNVTYLHLVPQLIRFADVIQGRVIEDDPFGQGFLERVASVHPNTRRARLKRIERTLKIAVPQFEKIGICS